MGKMQLVEFKAGGNLHIVTTVSVSVAYENHCSQNFINVD
jgi:hypothetical protein